MTDVESRELAGYAQLCSHGFALPCYRTSPHANTWYSADCSVADDHRGKIDGFRQVTSVDVKKLPEEKIRRVSVGDCWHDVFLWKQRQFVGAPNEIWVALGAQRASILEKAPISLLDLAIAADVSSWPTIAQRSYRYIQKNFGLRKARFWVLDTFLRSNIALSLRRLIGAHNLDLQLSATNKIRVTEVTRGLIRLDIEGHVYHELSDTGYLRAFQDAIDELSRPFDIKMEVATGPSPEAAVSVQGAAKRLSPPKAERAGENILLVALGRRAEEISRHFAEPEWTPYLRSPSPRWRFDRLDLGRHLFDQPDKKRGKLHLAVGGNLPRLSGYRVVVVLVDDEVLWESKDQNFTQSILEQIGVEARGVRLLAPVPLRDEPSKGLISANQLGDYVLRFHALVDTSVARSPFWPSYARRSFERRVADIALNSATLVAGTDLLQKFLIVRQETRPLPLLTFAVRSPRSSPILGRSWSDFIRLATASETIGLPESDQASLFSLDFNAKWRGREPYATHGRVQLAKASGNFSTFAYQVIADAARKVGQPRPKPVPNHLAPKAILDKLLFPELACLVVLLGNRPQRRMLVVSETPSVKALQAAADEEHALVRYTDVETIEEVLATDLPGRSWPLPREVLLPHVRKLAQNRRLATRGVDPRDIVLLSEAERSELKLGTSGLAKIFRHYRADVDNAADEQLYALPRSSIEEGLHTTRGAQRYALERVLRQSLRLSPKRPSDLNVAWAKAPRDCVRYVVADGVLPVLLLLLHANEVPAQKFFIVDGDAAVPAVLQSRVFEVWARATLSRSTSWMSRFSVTGTFETFPVVLPFELRPGAAGTSLLIKAGDKSLLALCSHWQHLHQEEASRVRKMNVVQHVAELRENPIRKELDRAILDIYGLPPDASDLDILRRLLVTNTRS